MSRFTQFYFFSKFYGLYRIHNFLAYIQVYSVHEVGLNDFSPVLQVFQVSKFSKDVQKAFSSTDLPRSFRLIQSCLWMDIWKGNPSMMYETYSDCQLICQQVFQLFCLFVHAFWICKFYYNKVCR